MDGLGADPLLARARAGDGVAMDELLVRVRPLVLRRCARVLPYREDAEDAAQEALLAIATRLGSYDGRGSFEGWASAVATNAARAAYRTLRRRFAESGGTQAPEAADPRTTSVIAGTRLDVLDALEHLEREHPAAVEAFVLRDVAALPYDEIAAQLGVPLGTVKARIHTARRHVRERLGDPDNLSGVPRI